jgi:hypothetical protein
MNPIFYIVIMNNRRSGDYVPEQDMRDMASVGKLITDICGGQYGCPVSVIEVNLTNRTSADCTADIARDCAAFLAQENRAASRKLFDFIDQNIANHDVKMAA